MMTMTPRLILAGMLAALLVAPVAAQTLQPLDRIAAVVNEDVVLQSELDRAVNNITAQYANQPGQLPPRNVLERQVLERLVLVKLQVATAAERGIRNGDWVGIQSRAGETVLRAEVSERMQPGVVYTTFHFPESGANVITTDNSDWATNCPEYKVTAVQVMPVMQPSAWQRENSRFHEVQQGLLNARTVMMVQTQ